MRIEDALIARAESDPEREAVRDLDRRIGYGALAGWARTIADQLGARGLSRGDRVSVFLDKSLEQVAALYGVWLAGGVAVPIAPALKRRQLEHIVAHSESALLVSAPFKLRRAFAEVPAGVELVEVEPAPAADHRLSSLSASRTATDGASAGEPAAILYTSGSTGLPKGVAVSHDNLRAGARIVSGYLGLRADDAILSVLPLSFDYGLNQLLTSVHVGARLVLQRSVRAVDIVRTLAREAITVLAGVPTLWLQLLDPRSSLDATPLPALRLITNSGGAFPVDAVREYRRRLPDCQIVLMYGLTEAFRSTYLPPDLIDERPDSIGRAIPECEVFLVDDAGEVLAVDDADAAGDVTGELVHAGPTVALGYWRDAEATARKFRRDPRVASSGPVAPRPPVVYSGDIVRADRDGFLYFVSRRDEMLKAYGYRISPTEVEAVIFQSGLVREVVVRGVADEVAGQRPLAYCIPGEGFSREALEAHCRREMPSYMLPVDFVERDEFPRTASGKPDRTRLDAEDDAEDES